MLPKANAESKNGPDPIFPIPDFCRLPTRIPGGRGVSVCCVCVEGGGQSADPYWCDVGPRKSVTDFHECGGHGMDHRRESARKPETYSLGSVNMLTSWSWLSTHDLMTTSFMFLYSFHAFGYHFNLKHLQVTATDHLPRLKRTGSRAM